MDIQCQRCRAVHGADVPGWVQQAGRPFRYRCAACGHAQMVEPPRTPVSPAPEDPAEKAEDHPPTEVPPGVMVASSEEPPRRSDTPRRNPDQLYLEQEGKCYLVADWATLERWVLEHRVTREDRLSRGGESWSPLAAIPSLTPFFARARALDEGNTEPPAPTYDAPLASEPEPADPELDDDSALGQPHASEIATDAPFDDDADWPPPSGRAPMAAITLLAVALALTCGVGISVLWWLRPAAEEEPLARAEADGRVPTEAPGELPPAPEEAEPAMGGDERADVPTAGDKDPIETDPLTQDDTPPGTAHGAGEEGDAWESSAEQPPEAERLAERPSEPGTPAEAAQEASRRAERDPSAAESPARDAGTADAPKEDRTPPEQRPVESAVLSPAHTADLAALATTPASLADRGWTRVSREEYPSALRLFRQALSVEPHHGEALYGLGYTLLRQGRHDQALGALCEARRFAPANDRREIAGILAARDLSCP